MNKLSFVAVAALVLSACGSAAVSGKSESVGVDGGAQVAQVEQSAVAAPEFSTVKVLNKYPHSSDAYTQGLVIEDGVMYESTGEYGHSSLRVVDITTGKVLKRESIGASYFGEGLAYLDGKLYQLTWMEGKCFVYDAKSFKKLSTSSYGGQGWGLVAYNGKLLMSDGSAEVKVLDPKTFRVESSFEVHDNRGKVKSINELEIVEGKLYANIYTSPIVAVIDIESGLVERYIDCSSLYREIGNPEGADVLNGIAYDSVAKRLYMTGKLWDTMFEVAL